MFQKLKLYIAYLKAKQTYRTKVSFDCSSLILPGACFEGSNKIGPHSVIGGNIGYGTYFGNSCKVQARNVGRFCSFGENVQCIFWKHPYTYPFVTTSPMFYSLRKQSGSTFSDKQVFNEIDLKPEIGNDVWIGSNVVIIGGVKIGDGAVVLSNAVVTKDIAPYTINGGVPAKEIAQRYTKDDIDLLLQIKWWSKSIDWLKEHWVLMTDINQFKAVLNK